MATTHTTPTVTEDQIKACEEQWNENGFWRRVGGNLFRYQGLSGRVVSLFHA